MLSIILAVAGSIGSWLPIRPTTSNQLKWSSAGLI